MLPSRHNGRSFGNEMVSEKEEVADVRYPERKRGLIGGYPQKEARSIKHCARSLRTSCYGQAAHSLIQMVCVKVKFDEV